MKPLIIAILCAAAASASISKDSQATANASPINAGLTYTHTTGTGLVNSMMLFLIGYNGTGTNTTSLSAVSYNSVAATKITKWNDGTHAQAIEVWCLLAPASGANTVSIAFAASQSAINILAATVVISGAKQSCASFDATMATPNESTGVTTKSTNLTTVANNCWIFDAVMTNGSLLTPTGNAGQTTVASAIGGAASYKGPVSPPGSTAMGWTWDGSSRNITQGGVSIAPAVPIAHRVK